MLNYSLGMIVTKEESLTHADGITVQVESMLTGVVHEIHFAVPTLAEAREELFGDAIDFKNQKWDFDSDENAISMIARFDQRANGGDLEIDKFWFRYYSGTGTKNLIRNEISVSRKSAFYPRRFTNERDGGFNERLAHLIRESMETPDLFAPRTNSIFKGLRTLSGAELTHCSGFDDKCGRTINKRIVVSYPVSANVSTQLYSDEIPCDKICDLDHAALDF
jgi:hypothetical protein